MARPKKTVHHDHAERIAVLETKVDAMFSSLKSIEGTVGTINTALNKNKGFWGGALLMVSAIWAFLTQLGPHIVSLFTTHPKQ